MTFVSNTLVLTNEAIMVMLQAAIKAASETGQEQCVVIVDASGEVISKFRMAKAKFIAMKSATTKARSAASLRNPTTVIPEPARGQIAVATQNSLTALPGGLPIIIDGQCIGGIGIGSGSGEQDIAVALAALSSINAKTDF